MTTFSSLANLDTAITTIHVHGMDEASRQLAPYLRVRYVQLRRGGACFHGAVARLGDTFIGRVGADRDKVEFIEIPRGRTLVLLPTHGLARLGTTCVTPGHAIVAHGPVRIVTYTDREYRMLFASMPDCWTGPLDSPLSVPTAVSAEDHVTVLRLSDSESRLFRCYVSRGLRHAARGYTVANVVPTFATLDTPLVYMCNSWLRERASRECVRGLGLARCRAAVRAREYIDEHLDQPMTLASVCQESYSSPRSLEYGFREIFGVSPVTYIRCARLSRVRSELCLSTQTYGRVTQVAMKWGFFHLSQFSSDYYDLFGELPSTTLALAQAPSTTQRGFDDGDDLLGRAGLQQHGVEEM